MLLGSKPRQLRNTVSTKRARDASQPLAYDDDIAGAKAVDKTARRRDGAGSIGILHDELLFRAQPTHSAVVRDLDGVAALRDFQAMLSVLGRGYQETHASGLGRRIVRRLVVLEMTLPVGMIRQHAADQRLRGGVEVGMHGRLSLRGPNVFVDVLRQHVERHVAAEDDAVVECLQVVLLRQRRLCLLALPVDFAVSNLVAAGLTRP
jgi:hypothetical protein